MLNTILNHRTIRKYKSDAIPAHDLNEILLAGTKASNTGNMQAYCMIVSKSAGIKEKLWECHFRQEMVRKAPVVITFCVDFNRVEKWCRNRKAEPGFDNFLSFTSAFVDAILASQNVALAAEDKGYGICYLGTATYNADKIIKVLNLPKGVVPVAAIVVGIPEEIPALTDRLPLDAVVHNETYNDFTDADIDRLYTEKENIPFHQELLKINNKETLAQIFTDLRYKKADNRVFSRSYLKVLEQQGFMNNEA